MNRIVKFCAATLLLAVAPVVAPIPSSAELKPTGIRSQNQGIVAPQGKEIVARYECRSRGPSTGEIVLRANGKYNVKNRQGKYQPSRRGYRFLTGALKGQSIVRQEGNIYLVSTKDEARAAELAAADGALLCTGGEIKY